MDISDEWMTMVNITDTLNWLELVAAVVMALGILLSASALRAAYRARRYLRQSGQNGTRLAVSGANVDNELLRLGAQVTELVMIVNAAALPSRYGWQSLVTSIGLIVVSVLLTLGSLRSRRLRDTLARGEY